MFFFSFLSVTIVYYELRLMFRQKVHILSKKSRVVFNVLNYIGQNSLSSLDVCKFCSQKQEWKKWESDTFQIPQICSLSLDASICASCRPIHHIDGESITNIELRCIESLHVL